MPISRRRFSRLAFVSALGAASVGGVAAILNYLFPRNADLRLKDLTIRAADVPAPSAQPLHNKEFKLLLVNIGEEHVAGAGVPRSRLLALSTICPHLRCTARWESEFTWRSPFSGTDQRGNIVCHCHDGFFSRAGVRFFGPTPHSLDTFRIEKKRGRLVVHLTEITEGGVDGGVEPLPWP